MLRGQALELLRDPASALEAYERAVRLWPKHATAHYDLATLLVGTGSEESCWPRRRTCAKPADRRRTSSTRIQLATVLPCRGVSTTRSRSSTHAERRHGRSPSCCSPRRRSTSRAARTWRRRRSCCASCSVRARSSEGHAAAVGHPPRVRSHVAPGGARGRDEARMRGALERFDAAAQARLCVGGRGRRRRRPVLAAALRRGPSPVRRGSAQVRRASAGSSA